MMKTQDFAGFEYKGSTNLGDDIQSIIAERLLPNVVQRFNRDTLAYAHSKVPLSIVMNGWFSHHPETCLPYSTNLCPIFWGFHITDWNNSWEYFSRREVGDYLKRYEPIGCRDPYTAERLFKLGIKTFVSYCLTLTLPRREKEPENGKIFVVDAFQIPLPKDLEMKAVYYTHTSRFKYRGALKRWYAKHLLHSYYSEACLVVTSRLHCLLPCIAMGIPVIFFNNPNDYRVSWVKELGVKIYTMKELEEIDWNPKPIDFEKEKMKLIDSFHLYKHNCLLRL